MKYVYLIKENSSYGVDVNIWPKAYSSYLLAFKSVDKYIENKGYERYEDNSWCKEDENSNEYIHIIKTPVI
jgi:hypothetical protein